MSKHPSCFRLTGDVLSDWTEGEGRRVLFRGSVAELCPLAPNNVNTMAAAAVAAGTLGFTGVQGEIVSDTAWVFLNKSDWPDAAFHICLNDTFHTSSCPRLSDYHVVEVDVMGSGGFSVNTVRRNPAKLGAVTGSATYNSFWNSLLGESCMVRSKYKNTLLQVIKYYQQIVSKSTCYAKKNAPVTDIYLHITWLHIVNTNASIHQQHLTGVPEWGGTSFTVAIYPVGSLVQVLPTCDKRVTRNIWQHLVVRWLMGLERRKKLSSAAKMCMDFSIIFAFVK